MKTYRLIALLMITLAGTSFTGTAQAIAYYGTYSSTLWNTPAQYFNDDDWKLFDQALKATLDSGEESKPRAWSNPATRASGEMTVLKTVNKGDRTCRELKIVNQANGSSHVSGVAFCRQEDGTWTVVSQH